MRNNKVLKRSITFLLVGIMIAMVFSLIPDTYSLFNKEFNGSNGKVVAATTKDIIADIDIYYEGDKPILMLKKATDYEFSPLVFFSVEGEIEEYILHMDPIRLEGEANISIIPNVNLSQAISLILSEESQIVGEVRVKYLNEFIDESISITLSRRYLLESYRLDNGLEDYEISSLSSEEKELLVKLIKDTLIFTERYLGWESAQYEEYGVRILDNGQYVLPISKVRISSNQESIIRMVAPDFLMYNERLYNILEVLCDEINREFENNNRLILGNEELVRNIEALKIERDQLINRNTSIEIENTQLNVDLNKYIKELEEREEDVSILELEKETEIIIDQEVNQVEETILGE